MQFFFTLLIFALSWIAFRVQSQILSEARELVFIEQSLMRRDLSFLNNFCSSSKEKKMCHMTVKARSQGAWRDLCSLGERALSSRVKRSFSFKRECRFLGNFLNMEFISVL